MTVLAVLYVSRGTEERARRGVILVDVSHKGGQIQIPRLSLGGSKKSGADPLRARSSVQQDAD
jgi:hypothetical protein